MIYINNYLPGKQYSTGPRFYLLDTIVQEESCYTMEKNAYRSILYVGICQSRTIGTY